MLVPIVVPTIVYALGIYRFWVDLRLLDTYTGVILVACGDRHSLRRGDGRDRAGRFRSPARTGGAQPRRQPARRALRRIVLPNIMPAVVSGAIFAFIHSWDELVIVLFIASRAILHAAAPHLGRHQGALDPTMAAVAVLLVLLTIILLGLDLMLRKRQI